MIFLNNSIFPGLQNYKPKLIIGFTSINIIGKCSTNHKHRICKAHGKRHKAIQRRFVSATCLNRSLIFWRTLSAVLEECTKKTTSSLLFNIIWKQSCVS